MILLTSPVAVIAAGSIAALAISMVAYALVCDARRLVEERLWRRDERRATQRLPVDPLELLYGLPCAPNPQIRRPS